MAAFGGPPELNRYGVLRQRDKRNSMLTLKKRKNDRIVPTPRLIRLKVLDATPLFIRHYALNAEQLLLAILRYNRLIDTFLDLTCYSLQNNVRTAIPGKRQIETHEIYIGINQKWRQYVIPVRAETSFVPIRESHIEQDMAVCLAKFPSLACRPVAAQFMANDLIALFEFERSEGMMSIKDEKHYRIVPNEKLSDEEIKAYGRK